MRRLNVGEAAAVICLTAATYACFEGVFTTQDASYDRAEAHAYSTLSNDFAAASRRTTSEEAGALESKAERYARLAQISEDLADIGDAEAGILFLGSAALVGFGALFAACGYYGFRTEEDAQVSLLFTEK